MTPEQKEAKVTEITEYLKLRYPWVDIAVVHQFAVGVVGQSHTSLVREMLSKPATWDIWFEKWMEFKL